MSRRLRLIALGSLIYLTSCSNSDITVSDSQGDAPLALTSDQQLIVAAFELDVGKVDSLLKSGAQSNARLGIYDQHLFEDKWSLGYSSVGSDMWTPLLAVAHSHREPQPQARTENTIAARDAAEIRRRSVDPKLIQERDHRRVKIVKRLISARADLNLDDGYGATALYCAIYNGFDDVALLLIEAGAELNTKTGIYIDGTGDITPLHRATDSPVVLAAMLKRGANVHAQDTTGDTPLDWARRSNDKCVKLLLEAGADLKVKDAER